MTTFLKDHKVDQGICTRCEHDLFIGSDGKCYCSNPKCIHKHKAKPHKTGPTVNQGKERKA